MGGSLCLDQSLRACLFSLRLSFKSQSELKMSLEKLKEGFCGVGLMKNEKFIILDGTKCVGIKRIGHLESLIWR